MTLDRRHFIAGGTAALLLSARGRDAVASAALPAGRGWQKLPTVPFRGKQDDIAFGSRTHGWYGNGEGLLYATSDGGDSWQEVWRHPGTYIRALGFLDEQTGILGNVGVDAYPNVSDPTPLYHSADGGRSWTAAPIQGPQPRGICAIEIGAGGVVHAAGRVGGPAHYLRSRDQGRSWTSADLSELTTAIFDVKFLNRRTGFIAGASGPDRESMRGLVLRSDDGGGSWHEVFRSARGFETVWKLHFPSGQVGYGSIQSYNPDTAVSQRHVCKTTDGGRTWSELPLVDEARWRSFGIGFADERIGWVGGTTGGLETRDGGRSWTPVEMGRAVNKIRFVGEGRRRRAYAIGSDLYRLDLG